jgi:hypothetical protein
VIGVIQRHRYELEGVRNNHRSGLKSGRERLQEMNRKLSKLTSKKKAILAFEAYSYFCIFILNMFCFHGKKYFFVPNCSHKSGGIYSLPPPQL